MSDGAMMERPSRRPMVFVAAIAALAFLLTTAVITFSSLRGMKGGRRGDAAFADYGAVPDFALTERSEKAVTRDGLLGSVWLADFIFTNCAGPCPLMSAHMAELQRALAPNPSVRLISFSVDPERDTPPVLRAYADQYGADPVRWWFLTGDLEKIKHLAVDGFHVGSLEAPLLHSTLFALVDQHGHIRAYYHSDDPDLIRRVTDDVTLLSRNRPT